MRRALKILALILVYFLACGKSCDNEEKFDARQEQAKVKAETDSLRSAFGKDTLSASSLLVFMETAKQKFYDFNDYLHIVADTSAAVPFREKAREMIRDLFIDGLEPTKIISPFGLDSVGLKDSFKRINDSVYEGHLVFSFRMLQQPGKIVNPSHETGTIAVFLVKRDKNFGKGKLRVWNVLLGEME
jgi:hypothetical protein